jgi:hypothetical protein
VLAVQRTDSALRLNVHFHVLALDGVYVRDTSTGRLVFHALGTPTRAEVAEVAARTAERIEKVLKKTGRSLDPEMAEGAPPEICSEEPGLAVCYAIPLDFARPPPPAIHSSSGSTRATAVKSRRLTETAGHGCSHTSFAPMSSSASAAAVRCDGPRRPRLARALRACSQNSGLRPSRRRSPPLPCPGN